MESYHKNAEKGVLVRQLYDCTSLMQQFPPKFKSTNKRAIFSVLCPNKHNDCNGILTFARYGYFSLPDYIPNPISFIHTKFKVTQDIYGYNEDDTEYCKHFYVNFADMNLSVFILLFHDLCVYNMWYLYMIGLECILGIYSLKMKL